MTKQEKIDIEIKRLKLEIERLKQLKKVVTGNTFEICPYCGTKNRHWNLSNTWTCAFC